MNKSDVGSPVIKLEVSNMDVFHCVITYTVPKNQLNFCTQTALLKRYREYVRFLLTFWTKTHMYCSILKIKLSTAVESCSVLLVKCYRVLLFGVPSLLVHSLPGPHKVYAKLRPLLCLYSQIPGERRRGLCGYKRVGYVDIRGWAMCIREGGLCEYKRGLLWIQYWGSYTV